jgi:GTP pyrophosphokinase
MHRIYVRTHGLEDWRRLLAEPERHWSPKRSAALVAQAWETAGDLPPRIRSVLERSDQPAFRGLELLLALPEHQVDLPPGGHPSQTDVWALARGAEGLVSLAVEGKVDESFGPTLGDLRRGGSDGQRARLRFLCDVLGLTNPPDAIRYQLLHRAVSALLEAERFTARHAVLVVQSFGLNNAGFTDFCAFARLLGADAAIGHVVPTNLAVPRQLWLAWVDMGPTEPVFMYAPDTGQSAPVPLTPTFVEALTYGFDAHWGHARKGTRIPYMSHLLAVAALVLEDGGNETDAIVAALLHDAVEDSGGAARLTDIRRRFGSDVADIVEACSDTDIIPKPPWRERKEAHLAHLRAAPPRVLRVAAADKLHNLRAILRDYRIHGEALWPRFNASRGDILWYYRQMLALLGTVGSTSLAGELRQTLDELDAAIANATSATGGRPT